MSCDALALRFLCGISNFDSGTSCELTRGLSAVPGQGIDDAQGTGGISPEELCEVFASPSMEVRNPSIRTLNQAQENSRQQHSTSTRALINPSLARKVQPDDREEETIPLELPHT